MKTLLTAALIALTLAGCGASPRVVGVGAPQAGLSAKKAANDGVVLKKLGTTGNGYVNQYTFTVTADDTTVSYRFDDTPLKDDDGGPYRTDSLSVTVDGKKISLSDEKAVTAAAKILAGGLDELEGNERKLTTTAVRALTWDL